jgi:RNA polymerase sigma-70 factor, ECF subfamily
MQNTANSHSNSTELLRRLQHGEEQAYREFVRDHERTVYALAYRLTGNRADAEDLTQDVFVKAIEAVRTFQGASLLQTWLHRIATNLFIDQTRSARHRYSAAWNEERDGESIHSATSGALPHTDASIESGVQNAHIERALASLSPQQRAVFVLRHFHDYALEEIASDLGVSVGTVKTQLFRATRNLRDALRIYKQDFESLPQK